ncbi:MAG: 7,8-didemethyl-8-hydroxy-5-deazariboflavin synthase CofG [Chloroflexota bacterium]|nr:7,8-didemethyl-8-hydroxy-5-deazariboflavin synthase CofG [Chloroflexota bacterium]
MINTPITQNQRIQDTNSEVLLKPISGLPLTSKEAYGLIGMFDDGLEDLCDAAAKVRDNRKQTFLTFSPKVFIPLTRLCRDTCSYCTFRTEPDNTPNIFMSPDEVLDVAKRGQSLGCTEALFTLGERPEKRYPEAQNWLNRNGYRTTLQYLGDMCKMVNEKTALLPHANPGTMSKREMSDLKPYNPSMGLMLENISPQLFAKGGPHEFAPSKRPSVRIKTITIAGILRIPFTTGLLIGIGETLEERIESLLYIRSLHHQFGHIQEVIIQNFRAKPQTQMESHPDASTKDLLWTIAVARLILGSPVNIQVPPNLSARDYQIYIDAGINDWGGISPLTIDYVNPEAPWPALSELRQKTESKGFSLRPRLPIYPEFIFNDKNFIGEEMMSKLIAMADSEGYVKEGIKRYA